MAKRVVDQSWHTMPSGVVIPDGFASQYEGSSSASYLQMKEKAVELERLYGEYGIAIPTACVLAKLINSAKSLSDSWLTHKFDGISIETLIRSGQLDRIADAALRLRGHPRCGEYLRVLCSGNLDPLVRKQSKAKDLLWELELWSMLLGRSLKAELAEPDVVIGFDGTQIAIACKKIYSERNVEKVLSQAVAQVESGFEFGIVAMNLDDLFPVRSMSRGIPTQAAAGQRVNEFNLQFLRTHERHFRKYLSGGRLISAWIFTGCSADLHAERTRFNTIRQSTIWTIPGLSQEKDIQLRRFYGGVIGN